MAFDPLKISFAPREGVFQVHLYRTTGDSLRTITSSTATDYFTDYGPQMALGDFILAEGSDGRGVFQITTQTTANAITLTPVGAAMRMPHTDDANNKFVFYATTADSLKTIASATATTYFATYASLLNQNDFMYVRGSDAQGTFRVTSADGSTAPALAPVGEIFALQSAISSTANVAPYGLILSTLASTSVITLDSPWGAGQTCSFSHTGPSTAVTLVGASTVAGFFGSTSLQILFNATNQAVSLRARSTAGWEVVGRAQPATAIVGPVMS